MGTLTTKALSPVLVTLIGVLCAFSLPAARSSVAANYSESSSSHALALPGDVGWDVVPPSR
ncbi:hypothetical protein [Streptacidiphilus neutrinimicus]|uniref:hypothetical protein n=1 Tax=Streptacidiphilus neutrinimicus TaxID=105420 RepID=UPI00126A65CD|nr:hypothetical protein [Streptacidiphilus neutrinimicus]